jgi:hypothetical protein
MGLEERTRPQGGPSTDERPHARAVLSQQLCEGVSRRRELIERQLVEAVDLRVEGA